MVLFPPCPAAADLRLRLVTVALVWVSRCGVGIGLAGVLSPAPEEEGDETEESETANDAADDATDCAAGESTGGGGGGCLC
jgi:hypothetical protein